MLDEVLKTPEVVVTVDVVCVMDVVCGSGKLFEGALEVEELEDD